MACTEIKGTGSAKVASPPVVADLLCAAEKRRNMKVNSLGIPQQNHSRQW